MCLHVASMFMGVLVSGLYILITFSISCTFTSTFTFFFHWTIRPVNQISYHSANGNSKE